MRSTPRFLAALVFSPCVAAAAPPAAAPVVRYDPGPLQLDAVARKPDAEAVKQIVGLARQAGAREILRGGASPTRLWSAADGATDTLSATERHERVALYGLVQRAGMPGVEADILVTGTDGMKVPVSITWELSGTITVTSGKPVKDLLQEGVTAEDVQKKYGVGPFTAAGAAWTPREIAAVDKALSLLGKEELALAQGFGFHRMASDRSGHRAHYHRQDSGMTIDVFNSCFAQDAEAFVGTVEQPHADSVGTLLHELAHAMSDSHGRHNAIRANEAVAAFKAMQDAQKSAPTPDGKAALKARFEEANALRKKNNAMDAAQIRGGRAAEKAFAVVLDPAVSVTAYGRTTLDENLAEAFRLWKLDEPALRRVSPAAADWFKAGHFAATASRPLE